MNFDKVIKEASAEVVGAGSTEKLITRVGSKEMSGSDVRSYSPNTYKVILKAVNYAKKVLGFDISTAKQPADVTIKSNGDVIVVDDKTGKQQRVSLKDLGLDANTLKAVQSELASAK